MREHRNLEVDIYIRVYKTRTFADSVNTNYCSVDVAYFLKKERISERPVARKCGR